MLLYYKLVQSPQVYYQSVASEFWGTMKIWDTKPVWSGCTTSMALFSIIACTSVDTKSCCARDSCNCGGTVAGLANPLVATENPELAVAPRGLVLSKPGSQLNSYYSLLY